MCRPVGRRCLFFFKHKTAYEITRRDWSSDVCSSDLLLGRLGGSHLVPRPRNPRSPDPAEQARSEEHTSELQSRLVISYAVFCLKKKKTTTSITSRTIHNIRII